MDASHSSRPTGPTSTSSSRGSDPAEVEARNSGGAHAVMFWFLTALSFLVFTPCVLMPLYVQTEMLREQERQMAAVVDGLEATVERNEMRIRALEADPLVLQRVVRRELNYRPEGERVVRWSQSDLAPVDVSTRDRDEAEASVLTGVFSSWLAGMRRWLPSWPWRQLFAYGVTRTMLLLMSAALLMTAFVLYRPRPAELSDAHA